MMEFFLAKNKLHWNKLTNLKLILKGIDGNRHDFVKVIWDIVQIVTSCNAVFSILFRFSTFVVLTQRSRNIV